jgi:hypothetical protein
MLLHAMKAKGMRMQSQGIETGWRNEASEKEKCNPLRLQQKKNDYFQKSPNPGHEKLSLFTSG